MSNHRPAALALLVLEPRPADAQGAGSPRPEVGPDSGDRVRLYVKQQSRSGSAGMRREGRLLRLDADSVVVRDGRRVRAFARGDVERMWVQSEPRSARRAALTYGIPLGLAGAALGAWVGSQLGEARYCTTGIGGDCSTRRRWLRAD